MGCLDGPAKAGKMRARLYPDVAGLRGYLPIAPCKRRATVLRVSSC